MSHTTRSAREIKFTVRLFPGPSEEVYSEAAILAGNPTPKGILLATLALLELYARDQNLTTPKALKHFADFALDMTGAP